jgi:hypothetical protein
VTNPLLARITIAVLFLGAAAPGAAGPLEDGVNAVRVGNSEIAVRLWRASARLTFATPTLISSTRGSCSVRR